MEETVRTFAYSEGRAIATKDVSLLSEQLAPDCRRLMAPKTFAQEMKAPEDGVTNDIYERQFSAMLHVVEERHPVIHELFCDTASRKAIVHLTHYIKLKEIVKPSEVENLVLLTFDKESDMIKKIVVFTDVAGTSKYIDQIRSLISSV